MLNRRLLRVKVLQALYAYFQSNSEEVGRAERELFLSIDRIYDLFLQLLILPVDLAHHATIKLHDSKSKNFLSEADRQLTNNFIENKIIERLQNDDSLNKLNKHRGISWSAEQDLVRLIFKKVKETSAYNDYLELKSPTIKQDSEFLLFLFRNILSKNELILNTFQEKSIYWNFDEYDYACGMVRNVLKKQESDSNFNLSIPPQYKDEADDIQFVRDLFRLTIQNSDESGRIISEKTKNWDLERIAVIDIIMMKMALTELTNFNSIPVKVSLNEYIEISKFFSSPKSKIFINGVLDKIIPELTKEKKIVKTGRGLMK